MTLLVDLSYFYTFSYSKTSSSSGSPEVAHNWGQRSLTQEAYKMWSWFYLKPCICTTNISCDDIEFLGGKTSAAFHNVWWGKTTVEWTVIACPCLAKLLQNHALCRLREIFKLGKIVYELAQCALVPKGMYGTRRICSKCTALWWAIYVAAEARIQVEAGVSSGVAILQGRVLRS